MKKLIVLAVLAAAFAVRGEELKTYELTPGDTVVRTPSRAVMVHAVSTNLTGTVALKKVTRFDCDWTESRIETNDVYTTAWSNLTHVVTNDVVYAYRVDSVTHISNFLAKAVGRIPDVYPWQDLVVFTNRETYAEVYTNIPYQVLASRDVCEVKALRRKTVCVTNDLADLTLSGGYGTNALDCILAPGDFISASGTAFEKGRVQIIVVK